MTDDVGNGAGFGLYLAPVAGGARRRITAPGGGANDFYPSFSPDGRQIAFARYTSNSAADCSWPASQETAPRQIHFFRFATRKGEPVVAVK